MKGAAATASMAAVPAAVGTARAASPTGSRVVPGANGALVAATVVRAKHVPSAPGSLAVGVRASVLSPAFAADGVVLVVEPVDFGAPPDQIGRQIAESVKGQIARYLDDRGHPTDPEEIVVRVFGGAL
jgi:hypothetical protein